MLSISVKPQIGEMACVHMPAFWNDFGNPVKYIHAGVINSVKKLTPGMLAILVSSTNQHIPEWRVEWFTFGGIIVQNLKFNPYKIVLEDKRILDNTKKK